MSIYRYIPSGKTAFRFTLIDKKNGYTEEEVEGYVDGYIHTEHGAMAIFIRCDGGLIESNKEPLLVHINSLKPLMG